MRRISRQLPRAASPRNLGLLNALAESGRPGSPADGLCLVCGLCCNGVIFADVRLQATDDPKRLRLLGLPLARVGGAKGSSTGRSTDGSSLLPAMKFRQPCAALEGCKCRIYADRPHYCREFKCALLKSVLAGHTPRDAALGAIQTARSRVDEVLSLLRQLGDHDEQLPLATRFRQTAGQAEAQGLDQERAELFGRLTLAVHNLNVLLAETFYPGAGVDNRFAETVKTR